MAKKSKSELPYPYPALLKYLRKRTITYTEESYPKTVSCCIRGELCTYDFIIAISEDDSIVRVRSVLPLRVPETHRSVVAEYLSRVNDGFYVGGFQYQFDEGNIGYTIGHIIPFGKIDRDILDWTITQCAAISDKYLPGLCQVMYAGTTPAEAIFFAEADDLACSESSTNQPE